MYWRRFILMSVMLFPVIGNGFFSYAYARRDSIDYAADLNVRPFYIMPTHGFYNGYNPEGRSFKAGAATDVRLSVSTAGRGVYQGLGAAVHTFGAHNLLGTPVTLYLFQGAPLLRLTPNMYAGYEWNLGVSAGWRNNGIVTVSPVNIYVNVAALITWRINRFWDMMCGPEYTHFSNGDTVFPNGGANLVNFRVGFRRHFAPAPKISVEPIFAHDMKDATLMGRITYDLLVMGGFRADRYIHDGKFNILNSAFPVASLNFNPQYHFNSHIGAGLSADLIYDRSANLVIRELEDGTTGYEYPDSMIQTSIGLSARMELQMPVFAVNIGIGYGVHLGDHTRYENPDLNGL